MRARLIRYLPFALVLIAWETAAHIGFANAVFLSSPSAVVQAIGYWFGSGRILPHLGWSLAEIAVGLGISIVVGVPLGLLVGWYRWLADGANPTLYFLDAIPVVGIAPAVPLVVGLGPWTAVVLVFFLTILPTILSVAAGVRTVPPDLLRMGRHFGADTRQLFRTVVLPAVGPYLFGAMRGNIGRAIAGILVGEWLGSNVGLGSMMFEATGVFEIKSVYVGAVTVVVISLVLSAALTAAERRTAIWRAN